MSEVSSPRLKTATFINLRNHVEIEGLGALARNGRNEKKLKQRARGALISAEAGRNEKKLKLVATSLRGCSPQCQGSQRKETKTGIPKMRRWICKGRNEKKLKRSLLAWFLGLPFPSQRKETKTSRISSSRIRSSCRNEKKLKQEAYILLLP